MPSEQPWSAFKAKIFLAALAVLFAAGCGGAGGDAGVTAPSPSPAPLPVTSIGVSGPGGTLQVGQAYQFTASLRDKNGTAVAGVAPSWSVTPASSAGVSSSGIVTPLTAGSSTITATSGSVSGNSVVTFADAATSLQADVLMSGEIFLPFNTSVKLNGTVTFHFPAGIFHNVIFSAKTGVPADIQLTQNVVIGRTFGVLGTFPFVCTIHPGMTGQITVVP